MKFDIKKIGIVFCLLCLMVTMTIPMAFAYNDNCYLSSGNEIEFVRTDYGRTTLYIDEETPLTFQYFLDNPDYSLSIKSSRAFKFYATKTSDQFFITGDVLNKATVEAVLSANQDFTADSGIAFYLDVNSPGTYIFNISHSGFSGGSIGFLDNVGSFASSLFSVATATAAWIIANPLALIVCIIFLIGCGIMLFRKLIKGA